jgi:DNA transformation protein
VSADQLIAHALDLFAPLGPGVTARKMFGGVGFYAAGRFFAIGDVEEGAVYLKVDEVTRGRFEAAGGRPFTYPARDGGVMVMSYFTPPDAALEDPEEMLPWARLGLDAAGRAAARKGPRPRASAKSRAKAEARPASARRVEKTRPAGKPGSQGKPRPRRPSTRRSRDSR